MTISSGRKLIWVAVAGTALVLAVAAFTWNEARKEVVFLCGNFQPGVAESSVLAQLDTGHFLRYRSEETASGRRIISDSIYTLSAFRCVIDVGEDGLVSVARLE